MKKTIFVFMAIVSILGLCACHKNNPQTMWAPDVDTSLNVPPVNTGGTSKKAPYENCNYGEDCSHAKKATTPPADVNGESSSITISETGSDGVTHSRTMTVTPDENGGGSIVFTGDDIN